MERGRWESKKTVSAIFVLAAFVACSTMNAQTWEDGMYRDGIHQMEWGGQLPLVTYTGKVIVDTSLSRSVMGFMMGRAYYIDTVGNGPRSLQLFFGPYWYEPTSGAKRPTNGQSITIKGGLMQLKPPMVAVYEINGKKWRDSVGAPAWSGRWINRGINDTVRVYCTTDSMSYLAFGRGFMGFGMMGGGMMWPDSLFGEFEQMHPDSLPGMSRGRAIMGFHMESYNPQGTMMMQGGMQGHGGMGFQNGVRMRFRVQPDSLRAHVMVMNQLTLMYLDTDKQWKVAGGHSIDLSSNSISIVSTNVYSFYALASASATSVKYGIGDVPTGFSLSQNYPNPFNPSTTISFSVQHKGYVTLKVFDGLGVQVASLLSQRLEPGTYDVRWNATNVASGIYVYRLQANGGTMSQKMVLIK